MIQPRYVGDGVYASFDGYHIQIHLGSHKAPPCVALEPEVLAAINQYQKDIQAHYAARKPVEGQDDEG